MFINNRFNIGDPVYVKSDPDQDMFQIIEILITDNNAIRYHCRFGTEITTFCEFELTSEKCLA